MIPLLKDTSLILKFIINNKAIEIIFMVNTIYMNFDLKIKRN